MRMFIYLTRENEGERKKKHLALSRSQTRSLLTMHKILYHSSYGDSTAHCNKGSCLHFQFQLDILSNAYAAYYVILVTGKWPIVATFNERKEKS